MPCGLYKRPAPLLDMVRTEGDPRPAGQALAQLSPWQNDPRAPSAGMLMLATLAGIWLVERVGEVVILPWTP